MVNDFGCLQIELVPFEHYEDAIAHFKKVFNRYKSSLMPFGVVLATRLTMMLPYTIPKFLMQDITDVFSFVYTNVCSSKTNYVWDGKKMLHHFTMPPGMCKLYTGIAMNTVGPNLSLCIFSDKTMLRDPQKLVDIMTRKNKEILGIDKA